MDVKVKHKWWEYHNNSEQETTSIVDKFVEKLYNDYGNELIDWKFTTFRSSTKTWLGVMYVLKKDDKRNID